MDVNNEATTAQPLCAHARTSKRCGGRPISKPILLGGSGVRVSGGLVGLTQACRHPQEPPRRADNNNNNNGATACCMPVRISGRFDRCASSSCKSAIIIVIINCIIIITIIGARRAAANPRSSLLL